MIQAIRKSEVPSAPVSPELIETVCQRAVRETLVRNARLGLPAVGSANGEIYFWSPERVLREFGAEFPLPVFSEHEYRSPRQPADQPA